MAGDDRFRQMFFEEARELLITLEEGLVELERRQGDRAHLDRVFRAAHSLKGAAAMVGLPGIAEFTHRIEAVLDRVRSGSIGVDADIITTLLEGRDHLAAMVEAEAADSAIPPSTDLNARLDALIRDPRRPGPDGGGGGGGGAPPPTPPPPPGPPPAPAAPTPPPAPQAVAPQAPEPKAEPEPEPPLWLESEPADEPPPKPRARARKKGEEGGAKARPRGSKGKKGAATPGVAEIAPQAVDDGKSLYRVHIKPGPDLLRRGVNPLGILDELRELGQTRVSTDPERVPPLEEMDPERCYLAWDIEVVTDAPAERFDDVFLFLGDDTTVTVEKKASAGAFEPHPVAHGLEAVAPPPAFPTRPAAPPPVAAPAPTPPPAPRPVAPPPPVAPAPALTVPPPVLKPAPAPVVPHPVAPVPPTLTLTPHPHAAPVPAPAPAVKHAPQPQQQARVAPRIRVDANQLDDLVGLAGELAVLSDNLQALREVAGASPWVHTLEALERVSRQIRDTTLDLRMVPVDELFSRFPRVVRDLSDRFGKEIDLKIVGQETRLDRTIVERLSDPMIHLIRNAVDHGLESPEERVARGKPRKGRICLSAGHEGDRVAIRVEDDGRGLDRDQIVRKGIAQGLVPVGTSADDPRVDTLIFEPGFSTRDKVTDLSGRGVGLDVVRDAVRALRGSLGVESNPGGGTSFIFRLPLTLALIDGLLVEAAGSRYVVPLAQVEECVALSGSRPALSQGRPCVAVRGELVPMVPLRKLFHATDEPPARQELLLTRHAGQRVGVAVDRLLGRVQAVIQALGEGLAGMNRFSGATILGDGSVSLILDLAALVTESRSADHHSHGSPAAGVGLRAEGF